MNSGIDKALRPVSDAFASGARPSASFLYEPFYGLHEKPFSLSADPRFLFRSPAHGPAFDEILAGIHRREGLIVLTGEIGTGKTTICRSVLQHLDRRTFAAFVADPFVSREDLLKTLLVDFGVISIGDLTRGRFNGASRSDLSYPLYEFLDSLVPLQAFAVLVIDEAQNLSLPLLEEIRILSELERREKLLQVVLVGQPELRSSLRLQEMRQVDQRVSVRCELTALDAAGVAGYVGHRLKVAGRGGSRVEFTTPALAAIYEGSSGVPRLINRICDRALQRAHASRTMEIDARFVWTAIGDLGLTAAAGFEEPVSNEKLSNENGPPAIADAPARPSAIVPAAASTTKSVTAMPLTAFHSEADRDTSRPHGQSIERSGIRHGWAAAAAATLFVVSASVGAAAWYARAQAVEGELAAALVPPPTPHIFSQQLNVPPVVQPPAPESAPVVEVERAVHVSIAPTQPRGYSILVASFENRQRAERLVEELTDAGYGAHAVERAGGATHGPLTQVKVSGYTSAIDVQRDLQRIRELPGGYGDAQIVERD
jgi:general secretion pathway protein A